MDVLRYHTIEELHELSLGELHALWELVPTDRQRAYKAAYEREVRTAGAVGSDALECQVAVELLKLYADSALVPVGSRWARTPGRVQDAAKENVVLDAPEDDLQPVSGQPSRKMLIAGALVALLFFGFLFTRLLGGGASALVEVTPEVSLTPTLEVSPTPTPLALEDQDEVIQGGEGGRTVAYPVNLQVMPPDGTSPRLWVVQRRRVAASEWNFDPNPDTASFVSGMSVRPVIGIPWSEENAAFFDRIGAGTDFLLTMNTGAALHFTFDDRRDVRRGEIGIFRQVGPGLVLLLIGETGAPTRRRAALESVTADADARALVDALVKNRLLQTGQEGDTAYLEIAHESLFHSWERLRNWIAEVQEDLILLRQVRNAAAEWAEKGCPDYLLWPHERLILIYQMRRRLKPELNDIERDFIEPEQARLLRELEKIETTHERRRDIGDRLSVIGDTRPGVGVKDGLPDIEWLPVAPGGEIMIEERNFKVEPFYIAKYQVTYAQFQAFVQAEDGFRNWAWWQGMPEEYQLQELTEQRTKSLNNPRDSVSWYQSVAFACWLNHRLTGFTLPNLGATTPHEGLGARLQGGLIGGAGGEKEMLVVGKNAQVQLPTEWEWQWAAQGGERAKEFPWGDRQESYANTLEAGLIRAVAVGMYLQGAAACGALDMTGNLWEWCLNNYSNPKKISISDENKKVLRGGSFNINRSRATSEYRNSSSPPIDGNHYGLRLVLAPLLAHSDFSPTIPFTGTMGR